MRHASLRRQQILSFVAMGLAAIGCARDPGASSAAATGEAAPAADELPLASDAEHDALRDAIDSIIDELGRRIPGLAIGLVRHGKRYFYAYGEAMSSGEPADERTFFELGSIGKTFLGAVLAERVLEGSVALSDPVARYLPAGTVVPERNGRKITLLDLATHRSGLPASLSTLPDGDIRTRDELLRELPGIRLMSAPGDRFRYSNLGAALLGHALAELDGTTWDEMVRRRVLEPLAMTDTAPELSASELERAAQGHGVFGNPTEPSRHNREDGEGPSGGHFTTARDMTRYLAAQLGVVRHPSPEALALSRRPQRQADRGKAIGLFWFLSLDGDGRLAAVDHDGVWNGFQNAARFDPESQVGVIVLGNRFALLPPWPASAIAEAIEELLESER